MAEVTIRELRNRGAEVFDRVTRGEALTVTRDGSPVAELRPLPRRALPAEVLLRRWSHVPSIDAAQFRAEIDALAKPSL